MRVFSPEIGKKVNLSAYEKRRVQARWRRLDFSCYFLATAPRPRYANEMKHFAREEEARRKSEEAKAAEEAKKKPKTLEELKKELEHRKPTIEELLRIKYSIEAEEITHIHAGATYFDVLGGKFGRAYNDKKWDCFRGKKILDIGCGSKTNYLETGDTRGAFEPWLCRALHECGARAIGVDICDNSSETFENYRANLSNEGALSKLFGKEDSGSFDAVITTLFVGENASQTLCHMTKREKREKMEAEIWQEASRLLKAGGFFIFNSEVYRKSTEGLLLKE